MTKLIWLIMSLKYKILFRKFGLPSYIAKPMYISGFSSISCGKYIRIFPHARIECIGAKSKLQIFNNISIGPNVNITCAGLLSIHSGVTISSNVFLTDMDHDYTQIDKPIMEQKNIIGKTEVGANCFIGTGAVILAGTILGKQCVVGANSVVRGVFEDYSVIVGNPAKVVKKYCLDKKEWIKL